MSKRFILAGLIFILFAAAGSAQTVVRVGAFPNITHPQAMVGKANGYFAKAMGPSVNIDWKSFNAGPSAIEALYSGAIDMTYIGPNPTISGYVRSDGQALRVIAGATSGGAALIVRNDSGIQKAQDLGLTLKEINDITFCGDKGLGPCCEMTTELFNRKIVELGTKIADLQGMKKRLKRTLGTWAKDGSQKKK